MMIETIENSPLFPYAQLLVVVLFFFAYFISPDKSPLGENKLETAKNKPNPSEKTAERSPLGKSVSHQKALNTKKVAHAPSFGTFATRQEAEQTEYLEWTVDYTK